MIFCSKTSKAEVTTQLRIPLNEMAKAINLFRAKSMADLRAQAFVRPNHSQPLTFRRLCDLYKEVKIKADQYLNVEGDQESAYICYHNAAEYLNMITKCEEYSHMSVNVDKLHDIYYIVNGVIKQYFRTEFEQQGADCEQLESALRLEP